MRSATSLAIAAKSASATDRFAISTYDVSLGKGRWLCIAARIRRFMRFRTTAFVETFLDTVHASALFPSVFAITREKRAEFSRFSGIMRRIAEPESRCCLGMRRCRSGYTASFARPLRRRRVRTRVPVAVFARERNPCVFSRLRFFGWYVRFVDMRRSMRHEVKKRNIRTSFQKTSQLRYPLDIHIVVNIATRRGQDSMCAAHAYNASIVPLK